MEKNDYIEKVEEFKQGSLFTTVGRIGEVLKPSNKQSNIKSWIEKGSEVIDTAIRDSDTENQYYMPFNAEEIAVLRNLLSKFNYWTEI